MMTEKNLIDLKNAKNVDEWNALCDSIKREHNGYPQDWFSRVVQSGLMAMTSKNWR